MGLQPKPATHTVHCQDTFVTNALTLTKFCGIRKERHHISHSVLAKSERSGEQPACNKNLSSAEELTNLEGLG